VCRSRTSRSARERRSAADPLPPKYVVDKGAVSLCARPEGGGVLGFAIAFLAFAFGGALGLPEWISVLVIGVGVLLVVLSAGMRGFGLAALVLGGIVLVSTMSLFGALGAARDQDEVSPPRIPHRDDTTTPGRRRVHPDAARQAVDRSLVGA
jgi:hypothetical protein